MTVNSKSVAQPARESCLALLILSSRIAKFGEPPASSLLRFSTSASTKGGEETS